MTSRPDARLQVIAHRGDSLHFPENTIPAFEAALAAGADAIELDVQLTRDRVPVVIHDEKVDRTTSGRGRVAQLTMDEIRALEARAPIPTLEEVIERFAGRMVVNVELKAHAFERAEPQDALERQVVAQIRRHACEQTVTISSFESLFLARLPDDIPRALLLRRRPDPGNTLRRALALGAFAVSPDARGLRRDAVQTWRDGGLAVLPWTVDDASRMRQLLEAGVSGLFTNDPGLLVGVLRGG